VGERLEGCTPSLGALELHFELPQAPAPSLQLLLCGED